ncbi:hypothetical protein MJD09_10625, partial [bacterium]|nr:hypothetical protein [bacterium]
DVVFDSEEIYIWSMQVDNADNLYVATGEKGKIYKIDAHGQHSVFYDSEDAHIRKIILDGRGNLIAGTSDKGMIIRIDVRGKAFVLYDSPLIEVTDLAIDGAGNLYAAVSGEARVPRLPPATASSRSGTSDGQGGSQEEDVVELPPQDVSSGRSGRSRKAELYKIEPDGTVRTFWSSRADRIFTITLGESGDVILGTGEPGKLFSFSEPGEYTLLNEFEELQVTAITASDQGNLFVSTSNTGKVYRSTVELSSSGDYLSEVIDASVNSHWGEIHWEADLPSKTAIAFHSRSGNTEEPDQS